ncbi:potassium voltage-gated channel subfamily C member 1-like [Sceloporus undulatus]|uniref:potassium voltage-gated channel subfamily C member 1-like n=1 Tax=Sceloporus undulatus TaxID=8520 RepID=UPI001C4ABA4A|nr:potassium voltage-gated channel subfamily C member 1-like [Sceloporus undulatus]XP_042335974.1 potassium voltage-gated channel subfamily C member 1-like [Sceloporus undulatus]
MKPMEEKITLNIGGVRFETYPRTLQAFPGTRLCRLTEPQACASLDYNPRLKEFFFDRNANFFDEVLNYYRTKRLHCPEEVCKSVLEEELAFWGIQEALLAPCCWQKVRKAEMQEEERKVWDEEDTQSLLDQAAGRRSSWRVRWQPKVWALFEKPHSSLSAKCLAAFSMLFNIGICILFLWKTYDMRGILHQYAMRGTLHHYGNRSGEFPPDEYSSQKKLPLFLHLELFFVLWFTFEFITRLTFCPDKKKFLRSALNLADFLSLFPVYVELFLAGAGNHPVYWLGFFRLAYFFKLLKVVKVVEPTLVFRVLSHTSSSLLREALILLLIFAFEIVFFGVLVYYADLLHKEHEMQFGSLMSSFWWAAITLTTVGYGDVVPLSTYSQAVGACVALSGVLTIVVPIPLFYIKFKGYYDAALVKERMKRMKKTPALLSS